MAKSREVSERIVALRKNRSETQTEFATAVGVTQQTISDWESQTGDAVPSFGSYAQLGNLAPYPDNLWFWLQAGVNVEAGLSAYTKLSGARGELALKRSILVPRLLKDGTLSPKDDDFLPWPAKYIPAPSSVAYRQIDHRAGEFTTGDLFRLADKTIIVLDTSDNDATGFQAFRGKVILVESTGEAKAHYPSALSSGIHMGRLRMKAWAGTSLDYMSYLAALAPLQGELRWASPPPGICLGVGSSTTKWRLRNPGVEPHHPRASGLAEDQATEEGTRFPGCTILGRVLCWFRPPSESGK